MNPGILLATLTLALTLMSGSANAQVLKAQIVGSVTDSSGAVISGATVKITRVVGTQFYVTAS